MPARGRAASAASPEVVATIDVDPETARVYEHGWQSWTPSGEYRLDATPHRPLDARWHRPPGHHEARPGGGFEGAGLLAVLPAAGEPVHVWSLADPGTNGSVPLIRAARRASQLVVTADGPVRQTVDTGPGGIQAALARWADGVAAAAGVAGIRRPPTAWCTWYQYFEGVTQADVLENLDAAGALDLAVDVVQIDDGWQAEVGDWRTSSAAFPDLAGLVRSIRAAGRRAGIWIAPFLAGARSAVVREHRDWLVPDASGEPAVVGRNWDQDLFALDPTHPGVRASLGEALGALRALGIDYVKADFVWAAGVDGARHDGSTALAAYRAGIELLRAAVGDAWLLGCGAPILPSVGVFDAMRVSPDTAPAWEPEDGDLSTPGGRSAVLTGEARAWQHGRFWVNDPDCLLVRPGIERREDRARHVERFGGLRASSDRLRDLDGWGLETTRRLLATPAPPRFVSPDTAP